MHVKSLVCCIVGSIALLQPISATANELSKADAAKLLALTGDKNVVVVSVVQGVGGLGMGAFSSPNVAMVMAYGERNGKPMQRHETFFYDKDHGWFTFEIDEKGRSARVWSTSGYKELRPKN